ncbi:hypothetical protein HOY80DRAFT_896680 [Tuber brumale]|nr:hypothetical protein HOY80DRAFT_896680 [Tuber brumale]
MPHDTDSDRDQNIRSCILALFKVEASAQGLTEPMGEGQISAWLRVIVPEIEGAFGVDIYTAQEQMLSRALDEIRRIFSQLKEKPDRVLEYVFTGRRPGNRAQ